MRNAVRALEIVAAAERDTSVGEIAKALGLPKSSASRLMTSLRDGGLLVQEPRSRRYRAGPLAWELGARYRPPGSEMSLYTESMAHLSETTGFTAWLAVLAGVDIIVLRHHHGTTPVQFAVRPGQRLPAHSTAIGKALLARLAERTVTNLFTEKLRKYTDTTLVSLDALLPELEQIRETGFAYSRQETFNGVNAIGVCLQGPVSDTPLGLGLSYPFQYETPMSAKLTLSTLRGEAVRIGTAIGDPFWGRDAGAAGAQTER